MRALNATVDHETVTRRAQIQAQVKVLGRRQARSESACLFYQLLAHTEDGGMNEGTKGLGGSVQEAGVQVLEVGPEVRNRKDLGIGPQDSPYLCSVGIQIQAIPEPVKALFREHYVSIQEEKVGMMCGLKAPVAGSSRAALRVEPDTLGRDIESGKNLKCRGGPVRRPIVNQNYLCLGKVVLRQRLQALHHLGHCIVGWDDD